MTTIKANPSQPPISTIDRYVSLLPANSKPLEHALASATAKLEPIPVPLEILWDADNTPSEFLSFLADAWSVDEWNDQWSDEVKRQMIKNSLWVHERKGTLGAVKRALAAMNYDATVVEWFNKFPKGTPGTFSIALHPTKGIIADSILQIRAVIDAVKRLSAHYDIYIGYTVPAVIAAQAVAIIGVEITVTN